LCAGGGVAAPFPDAWGWSIPGSGWMIRVFIGFLSV